MADQRSPPNDSLDAFFANQVARIEAGLDLTRERQAVRWLPVRDDILEEPLGIDEEDLDHYEVEVKK